MADQPAAWAEDNTRAWLAQADVRERYLEPVSEQLFAAAALRPGERVLDVGCGTGPTTVLAAGLVRPPGGPVGHVVGLDVSAGMIEAARSRPQPAGIEWKVADAQTHRFEAGAFDVVVSRFGTMFFPDPAAAFANLASAVAPGGRLAMCVWRRRPESEFFTSPYRIAQQVLDAHGASYVEPSPNEGPFSLGDRAETTDLLTGAGWRSPVFRPVDPPLYPGGPADPQTIGTIVSGLGPVSRLLDGQPEEVVADVRAALAAEAGRRFDGHGWPLRAGFWTVTAERR